MDTPQYTPKDIKCFWAKVNKDGSIPVHVPHLGQCWEWIKKINRGKSKNRQGVHYGKFRCDDRLIYSHRFSWEITNGKIPDGLWILHKCDNPSCVNPDHLFLGTANDNAKDRMKKHRHGKADWYGIRHHTKTKNG